jgi:hypothetical protein
MDVILKEKEGRRGTMTNERTNKRDGKEVWKERSR